MSFYVPFPMDLLGAILGDIARSSIETSEDGQFHYTQGQHQAQNDNENHPTSEALHRIAHNMKKMRKLWGAINEDYALGKSRLPMLPSLYADEGKNSIRSRYTAIQKMLNEGVFGPQFDILIGNILEPPTYPPIPTEGWVSAWQLELGFCDEKANEGEEACGICGENQPNVRTLGCTCKEEHCCSGCVLANFYVSTKQTLSTESKCAYCNAVYKMPNGIFLTKEHYTRENIAKYSVGVFSDDNRSGCHKCGGKSDAMLGCCETAKGESWCARCYYEFIWETTVSKGLPVCCVHCKKPCSVRIGREIQWAIKRPRNQQDNATKCKKPFVQ